MSVEGIPVDDLHEELEKAVPGSAEEQAILGRLRDRREGKTEEFRVARNAGLEQTADRGIVDPTAAQQIGRDAIEHVTGQHEIPVEAIEHPKQMH